MPSSHLILCRPLPLLPPIPPSIRVFSNESTLRMRWPKYWSFSISIIPSKEQPGLISFRMDWLDLLGVQETLKSLLQHYSSKASILWHSAFFTVQLSHPYMTTGKTIIAQSCSTLCDCSPPGSSVHGIFQARILEWVTILMQETPVWFLGWEDPLEIGYPLQFSWASLVAQLGKKSACNAGDLGLIPGLERSPGEGKGYPPSILAWRIPWGHKEWDRTEWLSLSLHFSLFVAQSIVHSTHYLCFSS